MTEGGRVAEDERSAGEDAMAAGGIDEEAVVAHCVDYWCVC